MNAEDGGHSMINLRDRICDVFQAHQYTNPGCTCGWGGVTKAHHDVHLADAVIGELQVGLFVDQPDWKADDE